MRWKVIKSNPRKAALLFVLFCLCIYAASYFVVASSAAVDVAREHAVQRGLLSNKSRVGFTGFRIRVVGQEGEASFRLIDSSSHRAVRFQVKKRAGQWKVVLANPETKGDGGN